MSENWDWRKSLRNEEMLSAYEEEVDSELLKLEFEMLNFLEFPDDLMLKLENMKEHGPHLKEFSEDPPLKKLLLDVKKSILLKYRPTGFEAKWIYWFHLQPGVTKEIKTSEGQTIGVTKTNSISVEDSVTASVGFPIDIVSVKVEASTSKTTFDAVQRNVIKTYNKTVTDTYENKTKSTMAFYHLYGIITYADGKKSNYNTGYQEVSTYGVECKRTLPKQDARDSWDSLMEE